MEEDTAILFGKRKLQEVSQVDYPGMLKNSRKGDNFQLFQNPQQWQDVSYEVALPSGHVAKSVHGTLPIPVDKGKMAKEYQLNLHPFQVLSIACLELNESILVSAPNSAGKTAVAEYAIAMAFRDKQKVIYACPSKALSNQKYKKFRQEFSNVDLMTIPSLSNATLLIMTTEVLRDMIYRYTNVLKDVGFVIFDDIHSINDRERGTVLEESIILLPPDVKMLFLSQTTSNAIEFTEWICKVKHKPCHMVSTNFRPTPLRHYVFPVGGVESYLVVDENKFQDVNFLRMLAAFQKMLRVEDSGNAKARIHENIAKIIEDSNYQPVVIFSFGRRECEQYAMAMLDIDINSKSENDKVHSTFNEAIDGLAEEIKNLPAIKWMLPLLLRGIAVYHSGVHPVIKKLVENLFQQGHVKALFTNNIGANMATKTIVFTNVEKWDGVTNKYVGSGDYIRMSGRAGRRGKDKHGICIMMIDKQPKMKTLTDMVLGKPSSLVSTFTLKYHTILNLKTHAEAQFTAEPEHVINNSFYKFQCEKSLLDRGKVEVLQNAAAIDISGVIDNDKFAKYHKISLKKAQLEKKLMPENIKCETYLRYLDSGSLVKVREGGTDWGWGVVVSAPKKPPIELGSRATLVNTLLHCSTCPYETSSCRRPYPPVPGEKGELRVVPVQISLIYALSKLQMSIPSDLKSFEEKQSVFSALEELKKYHPRGFPEQDMDAAEFSDILDEIEKLKVELSSLGMAGSRPQSLCSEVGKRLCVMRKLELIDHEDIVQLKGQVACLIDIENGLLITELMFNGAFEELDQHQMVALASCFIPGYISDGKTCLRKELEEPYKQLLAGARRVAEVQLACNMEINEDEYMESTMRPYLMDVFYSWSMGEMFKDVIKKTNLYDGDIIQRAEKFIELLEKLKFAAQVGKKLDLVDKFTNAIERLLHLVPV